MRFCCCIGLFLSLLLSYSGFASDLPADIEVPGNTVSPDGHYGITVNKFDPDKFYSEEPGNFLVELPNKRALGRLEGATGWTRHNHGGVMPTSWSDDSRTCLWYVDGKWFADTYVLAHLKDGQIAWQCNLLKLSQQEILARTRAQFPEEYAAMAAIESDGPSAYPDGFSVGVEIADQKLRFPLQLRVALTSDPKYRQHPDAINTWLQGSIDEHGTITWAEYGKGIMEVPNF